MWSYKKIYVTLFLLLILPILSSCGFKALYSTDNNKAKIFGILEIPELSSKEGYHLREELIKRFGQPKNSSYSLELKIKTVKINEVITTNNEITSYRLIMTAIYSIKNQNGNLVLPKQKSVVRTTFSSAQNSTGYITQIAEEAAKKRLAVKLGEDISTRIFILSEKWLQ